MKRSLFSIPFFLLVITLPGTPSAAQGTSTDTSTNPLLAELGRNESRIYSAPFDISLGARIDELALEPRLQRLGYDRVQNRPSQPGQYFWGHDVFWIFRRACRVGGEDHAARLIGLDLDRTDGRIVSTRDADFAPIESDALWLEPELLSESLAGDRATRRPTRLADLPEHVWRPILAAEDSRFFDHLGVDSRSVARALLANVKAGKVKQGGSTITQQLIKNRDLTPKRSLGRKASEALRSLALEATYTKEDILEAYLDQVYLGHVDGLAIHGLATAAHVYFGKKAAGLSLAEASLFAAMIQGPNRLSPIRHLEAAEERRQWVLDRMQSLDWVTESEIKRAKSTRIRLHRRRPEAPIGTPALSWIRAEAKAKAKKRFARGRGVVIWSTLDPVLQISAEKEAGLWLQRLRREHKHLKGAPLSLAIVSLDAQTGDVLALVGGDPAQRGGFDRSRSARRQPGSAIKPLLLLEAFERCGARDPVYPARRIADEPLEIQLASGSWAPTNSDGRFRGEVSLRDALRLSLNVPFARLGRWCGEKAIGERLRRAGLEVPDDPPPSFVLGSLEVSPLELAGAYTALANAGVASRPRPIRRMERPGGRRVGRFGTDQKRVVGNDSAFLVHDLLLEAARDGTAKAAAIDGLAVAAKTGTSSDRRDAWLAGYANGIVTVVWVGRDDGKPLRLTGAQGAAPLWRELMAKAAKARAAHTIRRPRGVVTRYFDPKSGLLVTRFNGRAQPEIFRRRALPPKKRLWRHDPDIEVIR